MLPLLLGAMFFVCLRFARKADLVHAQWSINGIIGGLVGKLLRKPVVTTLRGSDVNLATRWFIHRLVLRLCIRLSTKLVTVSESLASIALRQNPDIAKEKFCVIPNGIDDDCYVIQRASSSPKTTLEVVVVGNLTTNKGVDQILQALHVLNEHSIRLRVVGDGPEKARLARLASTLKLDQQVEFSEAVPPRLIPKLLAAADIFVLASHSEGRSNALLEAMAAAMPVIASDIPGIREIITNGANGLLFRDGDVQDLANQIAELAHAPSLRSQLGGAARQFVLDSGLRWSNTAARYSLLYREMLSDYTALRSRH